ncbi:MAG: complement resistance protein TraT [Candidatus Bathyarchaeota archaeon]|nr:complement resistance protein TraT [Candidatus Bathyarchaeota archaeon]
MTIKLKLTFSDKKRPYLLDVSSLLYDFELLHDLALMLYAEGYSNYKFSRFFWYRKGRPIRPNHKIRAIKIIKESPLIIVISVTEILILTGAFWAMVQTIEKISNWKINRQKLEAEAKKVQLEVIEKKMELERKLAERQASFIHDALIKRLEDCEITLEDIEMQIERSED